jgi:hypothetical protein
MDATGQDGSKMPNDQDPLLAPGLVTPATPSALGTQGRVQDWNLTARVPGVTGQAQVSRQVPD